jgi:Tfp pilus assembly protein PilO
MNAKQAIISFFEKVPFTLLLAVYIAYLGYGYYQFMNDESGEIHVKQAELRAARDDIQKLEKRVKTVSDFMQSLSVKKQELRQLAQDLQDTKVNLPETLDEADLMEIINLELNRAGLSYSHLTPLGKKSYEFYEASDFSFQSTGVFFQYLTFIESITSLRKILRVTEIKLTPVSPAWSSYVQLSGEMRISAYRYLGTKADELGNAANAAAANAGRGAPTSVNPGSANSPASARAVGRGESP